MTLSEHAQAVADALPPLTDGQRAKLAALLAGAVTASTSAPTLTATTRRDGGDARAA